MLVERALQPAPVAEPGERLGLGLLAQRLRRGDAVERAREVLHDALHRELVGRRLVDRPDARGQPTGRAEVERDAVDGVRMTVAVPVARAQPQRRPDGDVVDDELGRDHRRERRERERELLQPVDDVFVGELRRDPRRGRGRGLAPELLGVRHAREALRDLRGDPLEELRRGDPRSAFSSPAMSTPSVTPSPTSG